MFLTGKRIGRYYLQSLIEQGGMGDIYLALDTHLQRRVAFKVIKTAPAAHANTAAINEAVDLFKREANAVTLLDHPYILPLYDYGEETCEGMLLTYIVMPYRPEGTLADWISKRSRAGPITVYEAAHFLRQAASALQFAHDHGIIHRDVKPSNFLIMSNKQRPDRPDVQLADFGVAKFMRAISTPTGIIRGTPLYMAPEFWRGATVPASDQYALALMIYEMITGSHPFQGDGPEQLFYQHMYVEPPPPSELNPAISAEIDAVLLRALSKNPAHRYDSVAAFAKAFRQALVQKNAVAPAPVNKTQKAVMLESADVIERTHPARPLKPLPPLGGKRPGRNKRKLFIFGLAILLIFSGVSIVVYSTLHQANGIKQVASSSSLQSETASGRIHASQTAGANQNLTATSIAKNATATTVAAVATSVSATQTAVSNTKTAVAGATAIAATATAQAYNNILKVGPNQQGDSLQSSNTGFNWDTINAPSGVSCAYSQGAYHAGDPKSNDFSVCFEHQYDQLTDFACQVSMTIVKGDRGGIAFRANPVSGTYYYFYIDAKGNYGLALVNSFTQEPPLDQGFSSAIHAGLNQTNLVAVVAKGNDIMVFVNMQLILHATDSSNTVGNIGVVGQDVNNATDVAFSDMQIWY